MDMSSIGIIRKRFLNSSSEEKVQYAERQTNRGVYIDSRYDNEAYSRMQFLTPVSHSMGAHTDALCLTEDSSSSDEDETYEVSPATTSESLESPATAAAVRLMQT